MDWMLDDLLLARRWLLCQEPFPHLTAEDVFVDTFHAELTRAFTKILSRGLADGNNDPHRLARNIRGYDAYGLTFVPETAGPFNLFMSKPWIDLLSRIFKIENTGYINIGLHHHLPGSQGGNIHNDLNPGWFARDESAEGAAAGVSVARANRCHYTSGRAAGDHVVARRVVRSVACIYYFANHPWLRGDGGETGLYKSAEDAIQSPARFVPPTNNSLLAFECSPRSFHTFLSNKRSPRTSMMMWLHQEEGRTLERWGQGSIVEWAAGH